MQKVSSRAWKKANAVSFSAQISASQVRLEDFLSLPEEIYGHPKVYQEEMLVYQDCIKIHLAAAYLTQGIQFHYHWRITILTQIV